MGEKTILTTRATSKSSSVTQLATGVYLLALLGRNVGVEILVDSSHRRNAKRSFPGTLALTPALVVAILGLALALALAFTVTRARNGWASRSIAGI